MSFKFRYFWKCPNCGVKHQTEVCHNDQYHIVLHEAWCESDEQETCGTKFFIKFKLEGSQTFYKNLEFKREKP